MIFRDKAVGFRDPISGDIVGEVEWTQWDYALVDAVQLIEDYSNQHGIPIWDAEADNVEIEAHRKIDKFEAAKHRITGRDKYKGQPGEYFVPVPKKRFGEWPTFESWLEAQDTEKPQPSPFDDDEKSFVQGR